MSKIVIDFPFNSLKYWYYEGLNKPIGVTYMTGKYTVEYDSGSNLYYVINLYNDFLKYFFNKSEAEELRDLKNM